MILRPFAVAAALTAAFSLTGFWLGAQPSARTTIRRSPRSVWDSVYTEAQARRGDTVFSSTCAVCHGPKLAGIDDAPPLAGAAFLGNWEGLSVGGLYKRIRTSMPQDDPDKLRDDQVLNVVAYILRANAFPAGTNALDTNVDSLKLIKIEVARKKVDSILR